jgi:dTDP-4-dehydrorhamnose 3,5-epimerase
MEKLVNGKVVSGIDGVVIKPLIKIPDERGCILPMLRSDAHEFKGFGEINFNQINFGLIRGWLLYPKTIITCAVVLGMVKMVLFDPRKDSDTVGKFQELYIGDMNYCLVQIPCGVWNGVKGISTPFALIANCFTKPMEEIEVLSKSPSSSDILYKWDVKHG